MYVLYQTYDVGSGEIREIHDLLTERIKLLSGKDKLLMTLYIEKGNSFKQLAALAGVDETNISRRIRKLTKRLIDGEYIKCLQNSEFFNVSELAVAKEYFLDGLSIREVAEKEKITNYSVRKILKKIHHIITTIQEDDNKGLKSCLLTPYRRKSNGPDASRINLLRSAGCSA
jgi:predicted DNA-binding protein YlxM (UPF0122 family)